MLFLGWFDDSPKKLAVLKIEEAIAAYVERFKVRPTLVLVNEADRAVEVKGVTVRAEGRIGRNTFQIGREG
jgi:hypothetical protein